MSEDPISDWLAVAEQLDAMRHDHDEQCRLASMFRSAPAAAVVRMWADGKHWRTGKLLTAHETEGLVERWCALFDRLPPDDIAGEASLAGTQRVPIDEHPLLSMPDDAMLRPRDVRRLFGYARSTLKRHVKAGKFPRPQYTVPGERSIGWPARQLKAWVLSDGKETGIQH